MQACSTHPAPQFSLELRVRVSQYECSISNDSSAYSPMQGFESGPLIPEQHWKYSTRLTENATHYKEDFSCDTRSTSLPMICGPWPYLASGHAQASVWSRHANSVWTGSRGHTDVIGLISAASTQPANLASSPWQQPMKLARLNSSATTISYTKLFTLLSTGRSKSVCKLPRLG